MRTPWVGSMIAVASCVAAAAGPARAAGSGCSAASAVRAAADAGYAAARYRLEATGSAVHAALAEVAADRVLIAAVGRGERPAANARALADVGRPGHITAIRVHRGQDVLVETRRYPFDVAGASTPLRDARGAVLGTLEVTIQDVIGFIRLVHKFTGAEVVVRGAAGETKSSLAAALTPRLPTAGCIRLGGRGYAVRSFAQRSFTGEPLRVWVLRGA